MLTEREETIRIISARESDAPREKGLWKKKAPVENEVGVRLQQRWPQPATGFAAGSKVVVLDPDVAAAFRHPREK